MLTPPQPKDLVTIGYNKYVVLEYHQPNRLVALFWGSSWRFETIEKLYWINYYGFSIAPRLRELHLKYGMEWWIKILEQKEAEKRIRDERIRKQGASRWHR